MNLTGFEKHNIFSTDDAIVENKKAGFKMFEDHHAKRFDIKAISGISFDEEYELFLFVLSAKWNTRESGLVYSVQSFDPYSKNISTFIMEKTDNFRTCKDARKYIGKRVTKNKNPNNRVRRDT